MRDKVKFRQSNIELLRIIAIIGVIVLHFNNPSIGGGFGLVEQGSVNFFILYVLESCFIIAVNLFIMISGYFLITNNKRNFWRPIELIFQVMFFSFCKYMINGYMAGNIESKGIIRSLVPDNYFIILYITLYIVSPYINILIMNLNELNRKRFIATLLLAFAIHPTAVDLLSEITKQQFVELSSIGMYGSQWGYSIVNFVLCYIIGAYIFIYKDKLLKFKTSRLFVVFVINVCILTAWSLFNDSTGYFSTKSALEYCNPLIILNAVIIFIVFSKLKFNSKVVNELASATLTVFLCHSLFIRREVTKTFIVKGPLQMVASILGYAAFLYVLLYLVNKVYIVLKRIIFGKIEKKYNLMREY